MKTKSNKTYTVAQIAKLLRIGHSTAYDYVKVGLIKVSPDKAAGVSKKPRWVVPEAEYLRLKRDGIDSTGIKAKTAVIRAKAAKKKAKRGASAAPGRPGRPAKKKSAYSRGVTKKQVKRNAAAATRTAAKKQARRKKAR